MTSKLFSLPEGGARALVLLSLVVVATGANALTAGRASACSCMTQTVEEAALAATAVFEARVLKATPASEGPTVYSLKVVRYFKGSAPGDAQENVELRSASNSAACGVNLEEGESYLVFATLQEGGLWTSLCSGTAKVAQSHEAIGKLGMGVTPFDPGAGSDQKQPPSTPAPKSASPSDHHARGGCASCAIGARADRPDGKTPVRSVAAFAGVMLLLVLRLTRRRLV